MFVMLLPVPSASMVLFVNVLSELGVIKPAPLVNWLLLVGIALLKSAIELPIDACLASKAACKPLVLAIVSSPLFIVSLL